MSDKGVAAGNSMVVETRPHDWKVTLNIGGQRFRTWASTLSRIPGTRLSNLSQDAVEYDPEEKEFFFDHNPWLFAHVLDGFRKGEIHFPSSVCGSSVLAELQFWGLKEDLVSACCWKTCSQWEEDQKTLAFINKHNTSCQPYGGTKNFIWMFLDDARSSALAMVWCICYLLILLLSVVVVIVATLPSLEEEKALVYTNYICSLFFLVELTVRFVVCPKKFHFFLSFFNIIDTLHVVLMIIVFFLDVTHRVNPSAIQYLTATVTILRALSILKIVELSEKRLVIFLALQASLIEMLLHLVLIFVLVIVFSVAFYYAEKEDNYLDSILDACWWGIVTLTTVGYGDYYPQTLGGKIIASLCTISAILMIGINVAILSKNVIRYSSFSTRKGKPNPTAPSEANEHKI